MTDKEALLAQLAGIPAERAALAKQRKKIDDRELDLVAALVQAGATWGEIGAALGMPRQNAWRKYAPKLEKTRTVRVRPDRKETP